MQTMSLEVDVSEDRMLHLDIPVDLPPGKVELVLVMQPATNGAKQNGVHKSIQKSQQQLWDEFGKLTQFVFKDMTGKEIQKGRKDDENRY